MLVYQRVAVYDIPSKLIGYPFSLPDISPFLLVKSEKENPRGVSEHHIDIDQDWSVAISVNMNATIYSMGIPGS